jgi:hypothetical protein
MADTPNSVSGQLNFWGAASSIMIAAINRGQFPFALAALVLIVIILRLPQEDVSALAHQLIELVERMHILGFIAFGLTAILWYVHARWQREAISSEFEEIVKERDYFQKAAGVPVESSTPESNRQDT